MNTPILGPGLKSTKPRRGWRFIAEPAETAVCPKYVSEHTQTLLSIRLFSRYRIFFRSTKARLVPLPHARVAVSIYEVRTALAIGGKETIMKNKIFYTFTFICAVITMLAAGSADAQAPRLRATNRQVQTLLNRIESRTAAFRQEIGRNDRNQTNNTNRDDQITGLLNDFETATEELRTQFDSRQVLGGEVAEVLNKGTQINNFMTRGRISATAANQWASLRLDLNTLARYYGINWKPNQVAAAPPVQTAYAGTDYQLRNLISQIETKTDSYKRSMENSLDRDNINGTNPEDSIDTYVNKFEEATNRLKDRFNSRESTGADASEVLNRARYIDRFMANGRMTRAATTQWSSLRTDLNTLASYYRVSWDWNQQTPGFPGNQFPTGTGDTRITGTYRLNASRSDNVSSVIDRSLENYSATERDNIRRGLERRLTSPEMIAIEKNRNTVSLASSNSPQVTFEADGVAKTETNARGRTVTTTATADRNTITINYEGDRINDFYVTFAASGANQLNVTRRLYLENQNETITVSSVYDKINNTAQWPTVNTGPVFTGNSGGNNGGVNDFYVPNGTRLSTSLRGTVSTQASQIGDRFAMEVTSPSQYRGAVIEGRVAQSAKSGRVTGRANVTLEFDTITVNGRTYRFAGIIDGATAANGDSVTVTNEGTVRDTSQTQTTVVRAGIGAVLGAIIGAVAGGGQGAAIGAGVGAGAGAGSVLITGRDNIELGAGSTFNITATAPANTVNNRN